MKIYNTLTRKKEELKTIEENKIRMYVCGPTVYDFIHIGNARPMIIFDTFRRFMLSKGYDVNYISNFTDIDDKIINRANEEGVDSKYIANKYIDECKKDMKALNILEQTHAPKATEEVDGMIELIQKLIDTKHAYITEDGTVYFDTTSFKQYGKLSQKDLSALQSGFREIKISGEENKKNPTDFVLWKPKKEGEPYWNSPFCEGRPGWHTECCVMAPKYANGQLDIHAGGEDLIFPHHENEIAQYEAAYDEIFAKYWMHNAFLNINNQKMSKSLGNFFTVRDITNKFDGRVLRFFMLQAHYKVGLNFSFELMEQAKVALERIINCIQNLKFIYANVYNKEFDFRFNYANSKKANENYLNISTKYTFTDNDTIEIVSKINTLVNMFDEKMQDDLNTADAITAIFEIVKIINSNVNEKTEDQFLAFSYEIVLTLMGILGIDVTTNLKNSEKEDNTNEEEFVKKIEELIGKRSEAKKNKNFELADSIREELRNMGIEIEDTRMGVKWKKI